MNKKLWRCIIGLVFLILGYGLSGEPVFAACSGTCNLPSCSSECKTANITGLKWCDVTNGSKSVTCQDAGESGCYGEGSYTFNCGCTISSDKTSCSDYHSSKTGILCYCNGGSGYSLCTTDAECGDPATMQCCPDGTCESVESLCGGSDVSAVNCKNLAITGGPVDASGRLFKGYSYTLTATYDAGNRAGAAKKVVIKTGDYPDCGPIKITKIVGTDTYPFYWNTDTTGKHTIYCSINAAGDVCTGAGVCSGIRACAGPTIRTVVDVITTTPTPTRICTLTSTASCTATGTSISTTWNLSAHNFTIINQIEGRFHAGVVAYPDGQGDQSLMWGTGTSGTNVAKVTPGVSYKTSVAVYEGPPDDERGNYTCKSADTTLTCTTPIPTPLLPLCTSVGGLSTVVQNTSNNYTINANANGTTITSTNVYAYSVDYPSDPWIVPSVCSGSATSCTHPLTFSRLGTYKVSGDVTAGTVAATGNSKTCDPSCLYNGVTYYYNAACQKTVTVVSPTPTIAPTSPRWAWVSDPAQFF